MISHLMGTGRFSISPSTPTDPLGAGQKRKPAGPWVVVGEDPAGFAFLGWWANSLEQTCRAVTRHDVATSTESEFGGAPWAIIYLLADSAAVPAALQTDSMNVVRALQGYATPSPSDEIGRPACAAWLQLRQFREVSVRHVKGHVGHPWHSMADWLAGGISKGFATPTPFPEALLDFTRYVIQHEWGWVATADPCVRDAFPTCLGGLNTLEPSCERTCKNSGTCSTHPLLLLI